MALLRSQLEQLTEPNAFLWATGIEDTFVTAPWPVTGRTLDEYELTGHYERWEEDLGLVASLGVKAARYGVPWHRIQPSPDRWEWDFPDRALELLLNRGVAPIVDLVHYGLPPWLEGAYLNPDYPARVAEYAARLAERFKGRIHWYTPLNEPRITAWYCGKLGWWPPFRRGWRGFVAVMLGVCRGIVETVRALGEVDPEIVATHVDATDLYTTEDPALEEETSKRQEIVFLALDLVSGRVTPDHSLYSWLLHNGATAADLEWFVEHAVELPVVGINLYPMFTLKRLRRSPGRGLRIGMPYAGGDLVERLGQLYYSRYKRPLMITETASVGTVAKRQRWLDDSVEGVRRLREAGVPMVGYTWWPMFSLVAWAYRQGVRPPGEYLQHMGLWDLASGDGTGAPARDSSAHLPRDLVRTPTPLVAAYRELVAGGSSAVGPLIGNGRIGRAPT